MNGEVFNGLKYLGIVWMAGNECIDEKFTSSMSIETFKRTVTKKCGFPEVDSIFNHDLGCGASQSDAVSSRVYDGETTVPGEFPFLAAIHKIVGENRTTFNFFCAGTLFSSRHVLSGASSLSRFMFIRLIFTFFSRSLLPDSQRRRD